MNKYKPHIFFSKGEWVVTCKEGTGYLAILADIYVARLNGVLQ